MQHIHSNIQNSPDILPEAKSFDPICQECDKHHACFSCEECGQALCPKCDTKLHNKGKRAAHLREPLNTNILSQMTSSDEKTDKNSSVRSSLEQLSLTSKKMTVFYENKDSIKTGTKQKSNMVSEESNSQTKSNTNNILEKFNESSIEPNQEKIDKFEKLHQSLNITTNLNQSSLALSFTNESHLLINQSFTEDFAREIPIDDYQPYKNLELMNSLDLSHCVQKILRKYAEKGEVIIKKEIFEQNIIALYKNIDIASLLKEAEEAKIIQIISRKFGDSKPRLFISLFLDSLSIQALFWTVKSLINDQLTPNEKMLLSRIKEAFAIKLNPVIWQGIWKFLQKKAKEHNNLISVPQMTPLKIIETFNQQGTLLKILTLEDAPILLIDQESLTIKDQQIWDEFLKFLDIFFDEKTFTKKTEKAKWSSSVETFLSKNKTKTMIIPPKSSSKAIPGGKYGCAQLIKYCGPENLATLSLGKLSVLAQEAINRKLLDHYKTLLIKSTRFTLGIKLNETPVENYNVKEKNPEIKQKIQSINVIILDLLREHPNGISLARLPAEIKKRVRFYYDLHEIGFNKLKDLLVNMPNVEIIEMKGSKLSIAKLKKTDLFTFEHRNLIEPDQNSLKTFNETIKNIIECHSQGITGPELITNVKNIFRNDHRFHHILNSNTSFFSYLMQNFTDIINIEFKEETMIIRQKNSMNIIPKNLTNTNFSSFFQNETLKSDINVDSFNSASKTSNFFSSPQSNRYTNINTSLFNTNTSSINHVTTTPFLSANEENNKSYEEIIKALQKTSLGQSKVSYSYFGNGNSFSSPIYEMNEKPDKKINWNKSTCEDKSISLDPEVVDYLSNISKKDNNSNNINSNRFKTQ